MANEEQVERLKRGVEIWNAWRQDNSEVALDLHGASLNGINLNGAILDGANLGSADLSYAKLSGATLNRAILSYAKLGGAILRYAKLAEADLIVVDLHRANLRGATLRGANLDAANLREVAFHGVSLRGALLSRADLSGADLSGVDLSGANLSNATLAGADLSNAHFNETILSKIDLRATKGLTTINHRGPSHIELFSVQLPQDGSALIFLRGVGVPDEWIDDYRSHTMFPIQYHSLFISYSTKDDLLAQRLYADLQVQGVRCWFAPEDLKIGDKFRQRIDEAIHAQDKLLLLLSNNSIKSTWVEREVEAALEREGRQKREVLFPIRLDDAVMKTSQAWAATLRRMRHIGDFADWSNPQAYKIAFDRLLRDLKQEE